jgi:hypothetical protein
MSQNPIQSNTIRTIFGSHAFSSTAAPADWNGLPCDVADSSLSLATHKQKLETHSALPAV